MDGAEADGWAAGAYVLEEVVGVGDDQLPGVLFSVIVVTGNTPRVSTIPDHHRTDVGELKAGSSKL